MIWLSLCIIYLLRWISCTPSGKCKWTCAEAHIFLCALVNHQKWLKSRCTYIGHPKWQCMYWDAKHPFKTIFLWSLSATFGYGSLSRSFQRVDWLTGFPLHFQINLRNAGIFLDDACLLYSLDAAIPQYNEGINGVSFILVIFYIFYCHRGEDFVMIEIRCMEVPLYKQRLQICRLQSVLF